MATAQPIRTLDEVREEMARAAAEYRKSVAVLMRTLYEFDQMQGWEVDGFTSFSAWAASDALPLAEQTLDNLRALYAEMVVNHGVDPDEITSVGHSKVLLLLPSVRRGTMTADEAIKAAAQHSTIELREMRTRAAERDEPPRVLPRWDVRIPIICGCCDRPTGAYVHKRLRHEWPAGAVSRAKSRIDWEDVFGVKLGEPEVSEAVS